MSIESLISAIQLNKLIEETFTNQVTDNSMDLRLKHKYASNDMEKIHAQYAPEKDRIRSEMEGLDMTDQRDEYEALMTELKELKDEEEDKIEKIEDQMSQTEEEINLENDMLQIQIEALKADTEGFEEALSEQIEKQFNYFSK